MFLYMTLHFVRFDFLSHLKLEGDLLSLDAANNLARGVLGDDLVVVQHGKLLGGITAHEVQDGVDTAGVLLNPVGQVQDNSLDDNPQVFPGVVLGNLLHGVLSLRDRESLGLGSLLGSGSGRLVGNLSGSRAGNTAVGPLDGQLTGSRGVEVQGNLAQTLSGARGALEGVLEEVVAGTVTGDTAVDDTAKQ